jgi:hypothetical protein
MASVDLHWLSNGCKLRIGGACGRLVLGHVTTLNTMYYVHAFVRFPQYL